MSNRSRNTDKRGQFWSSIRNQKLDSLRWVMLHSGLNVAGLEDDDGKTGLMIAAGENKAKSILVMLDILRQKREIKEAIDRPDEAGRTPLMLAAGKGFLDVVDHLVYYGANTKAKDAKGLTARDHAAAGRHKHVSDYFDEAEAEAAAAAAGGGAREAGDGLDEDGLTSTQRSKLKKKQMKEQERAAMMAAVHAAASAKGDEMPEDLMAEEGDDGAAGGAGGAAGGGAGGPGESMVPPKLPASPPVAKWGEIVTVVADKRRELKVDHTGKKEEDAAAAAAALPAGTIDPALWHVGLLNRLELKLGPMLTAVPAEIGHLSLLQTLILAGNGLTALPASIASLSDLKFLDVSTNALVALPPPAVMAKLSKLEVLDVTNNRLTSLDSLAGVGTLVSLLADKNEISEVTGASLAFDKLGRLDILSLSYNKLKSLPTEVKALQALSVLNAAHNEIEELPEGVAELNIKKLKELKLLPNPIANKEVLRALEKENKKDMMKDLAKALAGKKGKGKK